jgi:hypothetical protein
MSISNEALLGGESRLHCGSVYHLVRLTGLGSDLVLPLYDVSMRVAYKSGDFFIDPCAELGSRLGDKRVYL